MNSINPIRQEYQEQHPLSFQKEPESHLTIQNQIEDIRRKIHHILRSQRHMQKSIRKSDVDQLTKSHKGVSDGYENQGWQHTFGVLAATVKTLASAFGGDHQISARISSVADICTQVTQVSVRFTDGDIAAFQSLIDHGREHRDMMSRSQEETSRYIQELLQTFHGALDRISRALESTIAPH